MYGKFISYTFKYKKSPPSAQHEFLTFDKYYLSNQPNKIWVWNIYHIIIVTAYLQSKYQIDKLPDLSSGLLTSCKIDVSYLKQFIISPVPIRGNDHLFEI